MHVSSIHHDLSQFPRNPGLPIGPSTRKLDSVSDSSFQGIEQSLEAKAGVGLRDLLSDEFASLARRRTGSEDPTFNEALDFSV